MFELNCALYATLPRSFRGEAGEGPGRPREERAGGAGLLLPQSEQEQEGGGRGGGGHPGAQDRHLPGGGKDLPLVSSCPWPVLTTFSQIQRSLSSNESQDRTLDDQDVHMQTALDRSLANMSVANRSHGANKSVNFAAKTSICQVLATPQVRKTTKDAGGKILF